jgi:hypothetical protein
MSEQLVCAHCGENIPYGALGVIRTLSPANGNPRGIPVCRPAGKNGTNAHQKPYDCFALVKTWGHELGSLKRHELAKWLQSDDFDATLQALTERLTNEPVPSSEGEI